LLNRDVIREELRNNLRVGLVTGGFGGLLLGFLFAAATLALNPQLLQSFRDILVVLLGLQLVYGVFCLSLGVVAALGKTLWFTFTGQKVSGTKTAAFITGAVFFLISAIYGFHWCRWHRIAGLAPEEVPTRSELPILLTIIAVSILLARLMTYAFYLLLIHFKKPERRQPGDLRKALLVLLYMGGAFTLFIGVLHFSQSAEKRFSGLNVDDISKRVAPVRLVGIDGMDERDVERLCGLDLLDWGTPCLDATTAPVLIGQRERQIAPLAWTVVATGQPLEAHGIVDYSAEVVRGLSRPFTVRPNQVGLFQLFQDVLPAFRLTRSMPMRSYMREAKGLWNMADDGGLETTVVNWWVSWPAERIRGAVVSDRTYLRLQNRERESGDVSGSDYETYPASLLSELQPFATDPIAAGATETASVRRSKPARERPSIRFAPNAATLALFAELEIPRTVLDADVFNARAALHLWKTKTPDLWILHLPGPDVLRRVLSRRIADPRVRQASYDRALEAYWETLGPILAEAYRSTVGYRAILTLPGWPLSPARGQRGTLSLTGPSVLTGDHPEIAIGEIAPTVLWLLGLPSSEEMSHPPRIGFFEPALIDSFPPRQIHSYGALETRALERIAAGDMDRERIELLRSLGYIDN